jgi:hypothetical protein
LKRLDIALQGGKLVYRALNAVIGALPGYDNAFWGIDN